MQGGLVGDVHADVHQGRGSKLASSKRRSSALPSPKRRARPGRSARTARSRAATKAAVTSMPVTSQPPLLCEVAGRAADAGADVEQRGFRSRGRGGRRSRRSGGASPGGNASGRAPRRRVGGNSAKFHRDLGTSRPERRCSGGHGRERRCPTPMPMAAGRPRRVTASSRRAAGPLAAGGRSPYPFADTLYLLDAQSYAAGPRRRRGTSARAPRAVLDFGRAPNPMEPLSGEGSGSDGRSRVTELPVR